MLMAKRRSRVVFKVQRDVLKKSGLVVFDGEVIMSVSLVDQVGGDLDFVGTLDDFVVYGQGLD